MNHCIFIGRLTKDPDCRENVSKFSIAVNRDFKNSQGQYDADFINCVAFGKTSELIEKYFHKGMKIGLMGRLQTGSYTNRDGNKVYTTDVVVDKVEFLESKTSSDSPKSETAGNNQGFENIPDGIDEELPFN